LESITMLRMTASNNIARIWVVAVAIAVAASPAIAAPAARETSDAPGAAGKARELRDKGIVKLNLSHYEDAVKLLEEAYELSRDPAILFDLVQAYRLSGNPERALTLCASFLRTAPSLSQRNREQIERTVAELGIIVEQIRLQGTGTSPAAVARARAAAKEKTPVGESLAASALEPPAATPDEPEKQKETEGEALALASLAAGAAKEAEAARSAELLRSDSVVTETAPSGRTNWKTLYRSPWVWTAVGLVACGVAALVVYESTKDPGPPRTSWGAQGMF
jgi:tetratricopeptide (TPR) repeat protein